MKARDFFTGRSFHQERQPIERIPLADIDDAPSSDAIIEAFSAAREAIQRIESKQLIHIGGEWSPSQFAKAS